MATPSRQAATEAMLAVMVGDKVSDGEYDPAAVGLLMNFHDDRPIGKTVTAAVSTDDDALTTPFAGNIAPDGANGDDVGSVLTVSGVAGALFSAGADGLKSIGFTTPTLLTIYKDANGFAAQEAVTFGAPVQGLGGVTTLTG